MQQVTVRVPASTSNLGPGFDCLGIALRIYNYVTVSRGRTEHTDEMVRSAGQRFFSRARHKSFPFSCVIKGDIPIARGLGSSVAVRLGIIHGLNELCGQPLDRHEIFELCAGLEGHPDNAAPGEYGGFNVVRGMQCQTFTISARLQFVLLIPDFEVMTNRARTLLPARIDRLSAVASCGNACAITAAFASREYGALRGAFVDHLHQPFRKKLVPRLDQVITAAESAGALGGFLSGSGSTICAITIQSAKRVARGMLAAAHSPGARTFIATADNRGARIMIDPKFKALKQVR